MQGSSSKAHSDESYSDTCNKIGSIIVRDAKSEDLIQATIFSNVNQFYMTSDGTLLLLFHHMVLTSALLSSVHLWHQVILFPPEVVRLQCSCLFLAMFQKAAVTQHIDRIKSHTKSNNGGYCNLVS